MLLPEESVFLPEKCMLLPEESVFVPGKSVLLREERVFVPGESVLLREERVFVPGESVLLKKERACGRSGPLYYGAVRLPPTQWRSGSNSTAAFGVYMRPCPRNSDNTGKRHSLYCCVYAFPP